MGPGTPGTRETHAGGEVVLKGQKPSAISGSFPVPCMEELSEHFTNHVSYVEVGYTTD